MMRLAYIFGGAVALGLVAAAGSMLLAPPRANTASVTMPISAPGPASEGWDNATDPQLAATPGATPLQPAASSGSVTVCPGHESIALADGRLLGHIPYPEANPADLVAPPPGFDGGNCQRVDREMKVALTSMIAAATKEEPQVGKMMMGISCFRSIERQRGLFCDAGKLATRGIAGQAKWVAPPGYSEHATGFTLDIGVRSRPECNVNPCFADTQTGKWLAVNARRFGFEMSFPKGNKQGVSYEAWHFRFVGSDRAKAVFARARKDFPSP